MAIGKYCSSVFPSMNARLVSMKTATLGGTVSLLALLVHYLAQDSELFSSTESFLCLWGIVLMITFSGLAGFLYQESQRIRQPVLSVLVRRMFYGLFPAFLVGFVFTILLWSDPFKETIFWLIFYGLGLLSTQQTAPRSLMVLGWAFTFIGVDLTTYLSIMQLPDPGDLAASMTMALTFGLFHLLYAGYLFVFRPKSGSAR